MRNVLQKLKKNIPRNLFYCDVGARGGIEAPWESFKKILNFISFEPDKEAYNALLKEGEENHLIYPYALSEGGKNNRSMEKVYRKAWEVHSLPWQRGRASL